MPLVVMCGLPASGKTTWARKIADYLKNEEGKQVHIVTEEEYLKGPKNDIMDDSRKEKDLRAKVKSEAQRLLNKDTVVIVDALNYIKGYRYELFCISKAVPTRQITVQCDTPAEVARGWNEAREAKEEQYTSTVFEHLVERFEYPDPQNRWDSPLYTVLPGEELPLKELCAGLLLNKPPKQNMSTQNKPVSETNYLAVIEKITSDIVQAIIEAKKSDDDEISVPHTNATVGFHQNANNAQLTKLKRQFVNLTKTTTSVTKETLGDMFVQYLNSQCS